MFNKPERTIERVQAAASEALNRLPKASDSDLFVSFYDSVVRLDKEYFARYETHPFADLIQRMSAQLPGIKTKIRKEQRFREKLASLDLNSPNFNHDMRELKSLLSDLSNLEVLSPNEIKNYEKCFGSIQNRFKTGLMESRANELVSKLSPAFKKGLESADTLIKGVGADLASQMIRSLKACSNLPISEMATAIEKKHSDLVQDGVKRRLEYAISRIVPQNHTFDKTFVQNFLHFITILDTFHTTSARPIFEKRWAQSLEVLQSQGKVPLDSLFAHYPNLSKEEFISVLCAMAELKYTRGLTLDILRSPTLFDEYFKRTDNALSDKLIRLYDENYKTHLLDPHAWFASYADSIKKPYSQAADINLNLESGTCFQNSLDRLALLLKTPNLKAENIRMGSTQEGRATQARLKYTYIDAKVGLMPINKAVELQAKSCQRLGLVLSGETPACTSPKELIKHLSPKKNFLGILTLACPDGAHAIDVQIDHKQKIFRFIDDNTGIVEMDSYEDFVNGFKTYLESLYPEFVAFKFETFSSAKT
ncbi:MAG TPA: hypothetical protein VHK67_07535 [Rhabdochlamydiaceae bacterium]|nr:hypothetical protein [Rhabdochlamydiaceae bacterium]